MRDYFATYRDSTALSTDLLVIMEGHAGRVLNATGAFAASDEVIVRFDDVAFEPRGIVIDPEGELLVTVTDSRRVN